MPFYALIHNASEGRPHIHPIRADGYVESEDGVVFTWDDRIVHQAPRRLVAEVRRFETAGDLYRFMAEVRSRRHGAGTLPITESGAVRVAGAKPSSGGTRQLAESVTVSVEGAARGPRRSR